MTINKSFPPCGSLSAEPACPVGRDSNETEKNNSSALGFTLVELIVAISIGIVVLTAFSSIFVSSLNDIRAINQTKQLHTNAVYIINTLTYDIKQAENLNVPDLSTLEIKYPDSTIKIIKIDGDNITIEDPLNIDPPDKIQLNSSDVEIKTSYTLDAFPVSIVFFQVMQRSVQLNFTIEYI